VLYFKNLEISLLHETTDVSISCTVAFLGSASSTNEPEVVRFDNLLLHPGLVISRRPGPQSIHISTLLASIHSLLHTDLEQWTNLQLSPKLFQLFCQPDLHPLPGADWIQVSTLQAPIFDRRWQHCSYNYRRLGPLSSIIFSPALLDPNHFDHAREVLAINPLLSVSEVHDLGHSLMCMGLHLETHFIVVFEHVSLPSLFSSSWVITGSGDCDQNPITQPAGMCCYALINVLSINFKMYSF